ncbi:MAG: replicative DNA helicase [Planctomycetota bacterium]
MERLVNMPPNCREFEASLLSGILLSDGKTLNHIGHLLEPGDFYSTRHQIIYRTVKAMWLEKRPIDLVTVHHELEKHGNLEKAGGRDYLIEIEDSLPAIENAAYYASTIRSYASKRRAIESSYKLLKGLENGNGDPAQVIAEIERHVNQGDNLEHTGLVSAENAVSELYEKLKSVQDGEMSGISTGFKDLNDFFWGFHPGEFYVLAGRPSMGKSALAWNFVRHIAMYQKIPTLVYSLEVGIEQCIINLLVQEGSLDGWRFRGARLREADWTRIGQAADKFCGLDLYFSESAKISEICTYTKVMKQQKDIGFLVVDYIGLISAGKAESRQLEVANISRTLKRLARELNIPVLAVSQLNRGVEYRETKRPFMSDLRESGAIEQDADVIMLMYRDEYYHPNSPDKGTAEVIVGKNRTGPTGVVKLAFIKEFLRFEDLVKESL